MLTRSISSVPRLVSEYISTVHRTFSHRDNIANDQLVRIGKAISTCMYLNLSQLFYSFFKSLVGKEVIVELKNDLW